MLGNPKTLKGAGGWILLGFVGAMTAVVIGQLFPQAIPLKATQTKL